MFLGDPQLVSTAPIVVGPELSSGEKVGGQQELLNLITSYSQRWGTHREHIITINDVIERSKELK